jgi:hypothetical protein
MIVYYNFINKTKNYEHNAFSVFACGCNKFINDFHKYKTYEKKQIFKIIIETNNWNNDDIILAIANVQNKNIYKYINGQLSIDNNYNNEDEYEDEDVEDYYIINENNKRKRIV